MKKYIIDANALISFVTDRSPEQQVKIAEILNDAACLKMVVLCPQNTLTEFVYVMEKVYNIPKTKIKKMIEDFIDMPGIEIVHKVNMKTLLSFWPEHVPDWGDAMVAALCKDTQGSIAVTFDQKFRQKIKKLDLSIF